MENYDLYTNTDNVYHFVQILWKIFNYSMLYQMLGSGGTKPQNYMLGGTKKLSRALLVGVWMQYTQWTA